MGRFQRVREQIRKLQVVSARQQANGLLNPAVINQLYLEYEQTGQLPENSLQRTCVLFFAAQSRAMMSTVPEAGLAGQEEYQAAEAVLVAAAQAFNRELEKAGAARRVGEALP
jgi:hypothetical protein